jgi:hypothetical protein
MATYKRIDGDYVINTLNSDDDVIVNTNTLKINGNLDVAGNLTYINVNELNIQDPFILLNASNTGSYAANSGVLTHITASTFAGIRYNDGSGKWEVSNTTSSSGVTGSWTPLSTGNVSVAGSDTQIQFNDGGAAFGGSANLTFDKTTSKFTVQGQVILGNIGATPSATSNSAALYNNIVGSGETGVYVKSTSVDQELISVNKAKLYALIF